MQVANPETDTSQSGRDVAWIAYVLHAIGYLSVTMLPALIGLVVNYAKRGEPGFVDSHHRWMIRTFWYGLLWYLLSAGALLSSAWPFVHLALQGAWSEGTVTIEWGTIFSSIGAAILGGTGLVIAWFWLVYRVIRGIVCLADSRPVP